MLRLLASVGLLSLSSGVLACESIDIPDKFRDQWQSNKTQYVVPVAVIPEAAKTSQASDYPTAPPAAAKCAVLQDLDGDGEEEFAALMQYTGPKKRSDSWSLDLIIMYDSETGVEQVTFPYAGQISNDGDSLRFYLTLRDAGPIDLQPGVFNLPRPGLVAYRDGKPAVIYFWNGRRFVQQAIGVDD